MKQNMPFLTYMVDSYTTDKAKIWEKDQKQLAIKDWTQKNKYMMELKRSKSHKHIATEIESAMASYGGRIMNRLQFIPTIKINDDLNQICQYVVTTTTFIKRLVEQENASPPFQVKIKLSISLFMRHTES